MKLLLVTEFFPGDSNLRFTGGVEARIYYLSRCLSKKNYLTILCRKTKNFYKPKEVFGVKVIPCGLITRYIEANVFSIFERLIYILSVFRQGLKIDFDVVEGSNITTYFPAYLLGIIRRKPAVAWYPDLLHKNWFAYFGPTGLFGEFIENLSLKFNWTKIIALSNTTKKKLIKAGVNSNKIKVIYGGVEVIKSKVPTRGWSAFGGKNEKSKIDEKKKNIICISRLVKYKKVIDLIKAFIILSKRYNYLTLTIVGQGSEEQKLKQEISANKLIKKVKFLNNLTRRELMVNLKRSFLFCLPSVIEGFGLSTIEACSLGIPYVISNIETHNEITQGGRGGLLFEKENASDLTSKIEILLNDNNLYQSKQKEALQLANIYHWQKIADQTEAVYKQCFTT